MPEPRAQRTLVKSPPELWAEISDAGTLARHLGEFGEIHITRLEAETTVVWEGDRARGTVELEPSGWGTRVTITAAAVAPEAPAEPEPVAAAEPEAVAEQPTTEAEVPVPAPEPEVPPRTGLLARLFRRRRRAPAVAPVAEPGPEPVLVTEPPGADPEPAAEPEPVAAEPEAPEAPQALDDERVEAVLAGVLDDLGAAHHRPFSRG
ncbi:hypothetical protein [Baekduia soli]|uniref:hypothetical protein n=1 Tax=Baekduia soli TaxID=496014 RepID=UPI0016525686|nr:hypothetical protein [Baekduia soli]